MLRGRSQDMQWKWASSCLGGAGKGLGEFLGGIQPCLHTGRQLAGSSKVLGTSL